MRPGTVLRDRERPGALHRTNAKARPAEMEADQLQHHELLRPDDELFTRATEIVTTLASSPTLALSATKRLVWNGLGASVEQRLAEESRTVSELSGTHDALEGLRAVIERRPPKFNGR